MLLALEAQSIAHTVEAESALHQATMASRVRLRITGQDADVVDVEFSPDGDYAASASFPPDSTVWIWETASGQELFRLPVSGFDGGFDPKATFNLKGNRLAILNPGDTVVLSFWDVPTGRESITASLPILTENMSDFELNPDWTQLAVAYEDGTAALWDLFTKQQLYELPIPAGGPVRFNFSHNGERLVSTTGNGISTVWEAANGREVFSLSHGSFLPREVVVALSRDGRFLAVDDADEPRFINIWDLEDTENGPISSLGPHGNIGFSIAFSADGAEVATTSFDQKARVWDPFTGQERLILCHGAWPRAVAFNEDGTRLLTGDENGAVRVWDIAPSGEAELLSFWAEGDEVQDLDVSPDGSRLATAHSDGTAKVWDLATGQALLMLEGHTDSLFGVGYSPNGERIATISSDGTAMIWDSHSGEGLLRLDGHGEGIVGCCFTGVIGVAFSPDGSRLATAGADKTARVWDASTGEDLLVLSGNATGLMGVAYSPDGHILVTTSDSPNPEVKIWDANTGRELFSLPPDHDDRIFGSNFNSDGSLLATASADQTAKVWDLDLTAGAGRLLATLVGHTSSVFRVAFSPDGRYLATASTVCNEMKLWDLANIPADSPSEILSLPGACDAAFTSDGNALIIPFQDGSMRIITLSAEELATIAKERLTRTYTAEECGKYRIDPCPVASEVQ